MTWTNDLRKWLEEAIHAVCRNTDAGVAHGKVKAYRAFPPALALTVTATSPASVNFTGIADQVDKNLAQARHVAFDPIRHAVVNPVAEVDGLRCRTVGEQLKRLFDAGRDLESVCLQLEIAGLNLGEVENVIDHRQQRIATMRTVST